MRVYTIIWIVLIILGGGLTLAGCGYHLVGSGQLPQGIVSVFVSEPINNTSESSLIASVSNELKNELTRRQIQMVETAQAADGILTSEITSLTDATIARRGATTALEKRLQIRMDLRLEKSDGQIVWKGKGITANETYTVINGDDLATNSNRQAALSTLFQRLAEDVYNRLSADF
ncbi:MAG: LPS assembly lipoprotein LptE [Desulfobacteraceae bacterium]|jgi:outer membrane lipopolysaccharide assembly protein LptE/RlpB